MLVLTAFSILDGLVVMIRLSHSRERGSIPRRGSYFFSFCSSWNLPVPRARARAFYRISVSTEIVYRANVEFWTIFPGSEQARFLQQEVDHLFARDSNLCPSHPSRRALEACHL